ncbi:hypothetical protein Q427_13945 [Halomonas sp. BC04]|nr:hypothetical protein Q427_13945 [Halomonas sp. BC04]
MNALIVDSTALPEQVVTDVIQSAFQSAGQRCSALRVLYLQDDVADRVIEILKGAMDELHVGDPRDLGTDVGPVIDEDARKGLMAHIDRLKGEGRLLAETRLDPAFTALGTFVAPVAFHIDGIDAWTGNSSARCCISCATRPMRSIRSSNRLTTGVTD